MRKKQLILIFAFLILISFKINSQTKHRYAQGYVANLEPEVNNVEDLIIILYCHNIK